MGHRAKGTAPLASRFGMMATTAVASLLLAIVTAGAFTQPPPPQPPPPAKVKLGLSINDPRAFRGYTLLNPMNKKTTYLIDMEGRVVKTWESKYNSMHAAYLLENGHLFRVAVLEGGERAFGGGPGSAGRIQEFDWDGDLVWDLPVPQRQAVSPPRRRQDAQRQRADGRLGQEDRRRGDRRRAEEGAGEQLRCCPTRSSRSSRRARPPARSSGNGTSGTTWSRTTTRARRTSATWPRIPSWSTSTSPRASMRPGPGGAAGPIAKKAAGPPRDPAKDAAKKAEAAEAQDASATSARPRSGRSASTRTGPTSTRSTTTPSSTRS